MPNNKPPKINRKPPKNDPRAKLEAKGFPPLPRKIETLEELELMTLFMRLDATDKRVILQHIRLLITISHPMFGSEFKLIN